MFPGPILLGHMSSGQIEPVKDGFRNLPLKFGPNRVSDSRDIADIEFLWGVGGDGFKPFLCKTKLRLG